MKEPPKKVATLALRRLLVELKEHRPDICIRFRLIGQMWTDHFLRVIHVTEWTVFLNDESSNKMVTVPDISQIMQFELDKPFQLYQPYYHYDVVIPEEG